MAIAGKKRSPLGDAASDQTRLQPESLAPLTAHLLHLQRAAGNRSVAQMLRNDRLSPLAEQTEQATDDSEATELEESGLDTETPEQQQQAETGPETPTDDLDNSPPTIDDQPEADAPEQQQAETGPETPTDDLDTSAPTDDQPETDTPEQQQQAETGPETPTDDLDSSAPTIDNEPAADAPEQQQQTETEPEPPTDDLDSSAPTDDDQPEAEAEAPTTEAQADASADTAQGASPAGPTSGSPGDAPESGAGNSPKRDPGLSEIDLSKFPELATLPIQRVPAGRPQRAPGATKAQLATAVQKFWNIGKTFTSPKTASPDRVAKADQIYQKALTLAGTATEKKYVRKMSRLYVRHILRLGLRHFAGELNRQKQTLVTDGRNSPEYRAAISNVATVRRLSRRLSTAKMKTLYDLVRDSQAANEKPTGLEGRLREFSTAGTAAAPRRSPRRRRRRMTKMIRHRKRKEATLPNLSVKGLTEAQQKQIRFGVYQLITLYNGPMEDRLGPKAAAAFEKTADLAVTWEAVGVLSMYLDKSGIKPWLRAVLKKDAPVLVPFLSAKPTLILDAHKSKVTEDALASITGAGLDLGVEFAGLGDTAFGGSLAMFGVLKQTWDMLKLLGEASEANHTLSHALGYAYGLVGYALGTEAPPMHLAVQGTSEDHWKRGVADAKKAYARIARGGPAYKYVLDMHRKTVKKMGGDAALQKIWPPIRDEYLARLHVPAKMYETIHWPPS